MRLHSAYIKAIEKLVYKSIGGFIIDIKNRLAILQACNILIDYCYLSSLSDFKESFSINDSEVFSATLLFASITSSTNS